ncbi:Hypothetical predicted protein [Mytilus galloprovincialis]|uniref:Tc1-like transposase DDE domain-containing protein n=1 Tax=Mytilus galloprovincialis TaxID=29158 RepID=A0A8B6G7H7_MYTGA|nr:Hypothetical predicted protein [Mytilus galloprovincialis]
MPRLGQNDHDRAVGMVQAGPALSPDLSPIEHLWDELDKHIRRHHHPPISVNQLRAALVEEWNNIPQAFIQRLIGPMRRKLPAVINSRGGHTRY